MRVCIYKEGHVNVIQCLSLCEKIILEERKHHVLMWLCSSEKHHCRLLDLLNKAELLWL